MKKNLLFLSLLIFTLSSYSQEELPRSIIDIQTEKSYYDENLLDSFLAEPEIQNIVIDLTSLGVQLNRSLNMLHFSSFETIDSFYDKLILYSNFVDSLMVFNSRFLRYNQCDSFPITPILYLFDHINNFSSLRCEIETKMLSAEHDNTPNSFIDNHYIVSDYMRTILNPNCAFAVGNDIFVIGEKKCVRIPDLNIGNLSHVLSFWLSLGEFEGTFIAEREGIGYDVTEDFQEKVDQQTCSKIRIIPRVVKDACMTYSFRLESMPSTSVNNYTWTFGDGSQYSGPFAQATNHSFNHPGTYDIDVTIAFRDTTSCHVHKKITVSECNVSIFKIHSSDSAGLYKFGVTASPCDTTAFITEYYWHFGDGSSTSYLKEPTHYYNHDAQYTITIRATFSNGCIAYDTIRLTVSGTGNCCKANSPNQKTNVYMINNRKIEHHFSMCNIPLFHRIIVKNIHFKRKNNGKWVREKAAYLWCNFGGEIYKDNCVNRINKNPIGLATVQKKACTYDYGIGTPFRPLRKSIFSKYRAYTSNPSGEVSNMHSLELHNKTCN